MPTACLVDGSMGASHNALALPRRTLKYRQGLADFRQVTPKTTRDSLGYGIMLTTVRDSFSWSYLECGPAQGGRISADHEAYSNRCGPSASTGLSVNIKDIDPVAGLGCLVVQKSPRAVWLLVEFWCAEEGLPGVPYWLWQRQGASD